MMQTEQTAAAPAKVLQEFASADLTDAQFRTVTELVHRVSGIHLKDGKEGLVRARLLKRLRALRMSSFEAYLAHLENDRSDAEMSAMIDVLTTNKTDFFREDRHFDFLRSVLLPQTRALGRTIRIWSAGCSSGEEPYTLAIVLRETFQDIEALDARVLATDISTTVLAKARAGVYSLDKLAGVPVELRQRYFEHIGGPEDEYSVRNIARSQILFSKLNLMDPWPMTGRFDAIFCRNVMIYFDKPTQCKLVNRFAEYLRPGGCLFVGHSESLAAVSTMLKYVQPAVYARI